MHAPPDGYTLFLCSTTHSINPALRKLPYDTLADFTPITLVASSPLVFVVHPSLGVSTIQRARREGQGRARAHQLRLVRARAPAVTCPSSF